MKISKYFTLEEMTKSQIAARHGIDNTPSPQVAAALTRVALEILDPVREHFGVPITPSSGYRSPALNAKVSKSKNSQHTKGEAVDFEVPGVPNFLVAKWIRDNLEFDQLILEFYDPYKGPHSGWVHCSLKAGGNRNQVLTINGRGTFKGLWTG